MYVEYSTWTNFNMVNGSLNNLSFCSPLLRIHFITCKYCLDPIRQHYRLNTIFKGILQKIGIFYIHNPKSCFCVCIPVKIKQVLGCSGISEKKQTNLYIFSVHVSKYVNSSMHCSKTCSLWGSGSNQNTYIVPHYTHLVSNCASHRLVTYSLLP